MKHVLLKSIMFLIKIYQRCISPALGHHCRFYPSCSCYSLVSLEKYGLFKGIYRSVKRICKCHPFHPGGVDLP
ncbi:MAG: membrane protein insertion efficiency factor YidD [Silvanigrellaceae bacterium]|nr:membrane protein insertion efficiency factor YidD [Silvanigrellaceae bacterium]